jgi:hypothetical protein
MLLLHSSRPLACLPAVHANQLLNLCQALTTQHRRKYNVRCILSRCLIFRFSANLSFALLYYLKRNKCFSLENTRETPKDKVDNLPPAPLDSRAISAFYLTATCVAVRCMTEWSRFHGKRNPVSMRAGCEKKHARQTSLGSLSQMSLHIWKHSMTHSFGTRFFLIAKLSAGYIRTP